MVVQRLLEQLRSLEADERGADERSEEGAGHQRRARRRGQPQAIVEATFEVADGREADADPGEPTSHHHTQREEPVDRSVGGEAGDLDDREERAREGDRLEDRHHDRGHERRRQPGDVCREPR